MHNCDSGARRGGGRRRGSVADASSASTPQGVAKATVQFSAVSDQAERSRSGARRGVGRRRGSVADASSAHTPQGVAEGSRCLGATKRTMKKPAQFTEDPEKRAGYQPTRIKNLVIKISAYGIISGYL